MSYDTACQRDLHHTIIVHNHNADLMADHKACRLPTQLFGFLHKIFLYGVQAAIDTIYAAIEAKRECAQCRQAWYAATWQDPQQDFPLQHEASLLKAAGFLTPLL